MKKTFTLTNPKVQYARQIESAKNDLRKYLKRERRKKLPEDVDYWDFDCKYGETAESAATVHVAEIVKSVDKAESKELTSFYIEILAKPGIRNKKQVEETPSEETPTIEEK
tara:strand:- start:102 stop:434 length:333 start_codon:yes stop_codon:yes gene_type:complete